MRRALVGVPLAFAVAIAASAQPAPASPFRLCVYTAESKFVDADSKDRAALVVEIQAALIKTALIRKGDAILVKKPADADVAIEVLGREPLPVVRVDQVRGTIYADRIPKVRFNLIVGDTTITMTGQPQRYWDSGGWVNDLKDVTKQVEKWITDNATRIPRTPKEENPRR